MSPSKNAPTHRVTPRGALTEERLARLETQLGLIHVLEAHPDLAERFEAGKAGGVYFGLPVEARADYPPDGWTILVRG